MRHACWAVAGLIAIVVLAVPASADIWDFGAPTVALENQPVPTGATDSVTVDGITLTCHGYTAANADNALYYKNTGLDEHGVGFVTSDADHEINLLDLTHINNYIQVDVSPVYHIGTPGGIRVQSVTGGEAYDLWESNTAGDLGAMVQTGITDDNIFHALPNWGSFKFYSVTVTTGHGSTDNVLMDSIQTTVPEPGTMGLLLMGLPALGLLKRRLTK